MFKLEDIKAAIHSVCTPGAATNKQQQQQHIQTSAAAAAYTDSSSSKQIEPAAERRQ